MVSRLLTAALLVGMVVALMTLAAPKNTNSGGNDSDVVVRVAGADVSNKPVPWLAAQNSVERARAVAALGVPLLPNSLIGGYAGDEAGFVSYIWQLPHADDLAGNPDWQRALWGRYAVDVLPESLEPGDILVNLRSGAYGHAVIFDHWSEADRWNGKPDLSDKAWVAQQFAEGVPFVGQELDRFAGQPQIRQRTYTLQTFNGALTVRESNAEVPGPYFALRNNALEGYVTTLAGVQVPFQANTGSPLAARFVLVNRGGKAVTLRRVSLVAYGPNALQQGVAGTALVLPEGNATVLAPGEVFEYRQSYAFAQPGLYVVLPRFEANGVLSMPLETAYIQVQSK